MSRSYTLRNCTALKLLRAKLLQSRLPQWVRSFVHHNKGLINSPLLALNLLVMLMLILLQSLGSFERGELALFDAAIRRGSQEYLDPRLVIVGITEEDIQRYQWPLSDGQLAEVLAALQEHNPRVIGLDIYRDHKVGEGEEALAEQLRADNLIAIQNLASGVTAPAIVRDDQVGFNDVILDRDQVVRRHLLFANTLEGEISYSFGLRVVLKYLEPEGITLENDPRHPEGIRFGKSRLVPLSSSAGGYHHIDDSGYQIFLNYVQDGPSSEAQIISVGQLLDGDFNPQLLRDRIVLIGSIAPTLRDHFATPFSAQQTESDTVKMRGVELHRNMVNQLIGLALGQQRTWRVVPNWLQWLWGWAWIALVMGLVWRLRHPGLLLGALLLTVLGLSVLEWGFLALKIWLPGIWIRWGMVLAGTLTLIYALAHHFLNDPLTKLPNQTLLYEVWPSWRFWTWGQSRCMGAIVLDLNRFKAVNTCLGYDQGDRILIDISKRLQSLLQPGDYLARVGADEFVLLLPKAPSLDAVMEVAQQLRRYLRRPFILETGQPVFLTASIGVAYGRQAQSLLLDDANCAMHRAKALQMSQPIAFDPEVNLQAIATFQLELDLRESMSHSQVYLPPQHPAHEEGLTDSNLPHSELGDRFRVYYQPLVDLHSGQIAGFEALLRWQHPQRGMVSPAEFIPVAEETGAIVPLGAWVLYEACYQMQVWQREFPGYEQSIISVNLSPYQLQASDLKQRLRDILSETGLDPQCLKLEITESAVMEEIQTTLEILHDLKSLQVKLGIDDFGTGYSSLSYLNRFPVNTLKIDRSFVWRMENSAQDRAIIRTILELAHILGLDVIAEGIETPEQLAQLRALGCDIGQGYWFAKPLPAPAAAQLLARRPSW
ncbi:MAG: EAL domain-containing protein [Phormidium sp. BM_Day4_Bin.17]|nr:EAL domain-containing protein [Phormidium sp. BM_Day4_Bin.17]UCJ12405.1 MAG: EAL domain-containing protein [Phormidium sp. PBR-2020]